MNACTVGDGYVRLVESASRDVIKDVSVTVIEPQATGQQATTITINGLTSDDLVPGGSGDSFSVAVTGLQSNVEHELHTVVLNSISAAFNRGCTRFRATTDILGLPSTTEFYTVYGCVAPGNWIWSYVEEVGGTTLISTGLFDNPVNVEDPNEGPTITSGPTSVIYGECRTGSVGTYSASDPDDDPISWSLPNTSFETDRFDFDISSRGALTFDDTPDYEDPDDHNDDNVYRITVRASDGSGGTDDRDVTVTVTNRAPTITSGSFSVSYAEGGTDSVATYEASDPCGGSVTWSLPNTSFETDRLDFGISSGGVLTFDSPPDYDDPDDSNDDNVYRITVRASDGSGGTDDRNVTVTVTNGGPTITSGPSSVIYGECQTGPVGNYVASDPDGDPITWSPHGTDRSDFDISSRGVLTFDSSPDYEDPDDSNNDNVYRVTVRASDGNGGSDERDVAVTVTNRDPSISSGSSSVSYAEGGTVSVATYRASDPCGGAITWSLPNTSFETDRFDFGISSGGVLTFAASPDYEDPDDSNVDNVYRITVRASDGILTASRDVTVTVTNVNENIPPDITGGPSSASYAEGGTGSVATYRASDPDGDPITWSLPNTSFETDRFDFGISSGGVLTFDSSPDYEDPDDSNRDNVYRVTVRASDGSGGSDDRDVTVTVTNVNENIPPDITGGPSSASYAEGGTGSVATYRASDPDGDPITWSLPNTSFETDRFDFGISSGGVLTFDSSPDYEDPDDSNRDNVYRVTVRASDGSGGSDDRNVTVTVTNRAPTITSGSSSASYAEGGTVSVATYRASDPGGGAITWSLPNTSFETDRFDFDISPGGVLTFAASPDYEDPDDSNVDNDYRITVRASDGILTASRDVTVTVTNGPPTITSGSPSVSYDEGGTGSVATYRASDPGGGAVTWSLPNTSFETDRFDVARLRGSRRLQRRQRLQDHGQGQRRHSHRQQGCYRDRHERAPDDHFRLSFGELRRRRNRLGGDLPRLGPRRRRRNMVAPQHLLRDRPVRFRHIPRRSAHVRGFARLRGSRRLQRRQRLQDHRQGQRRQRQHGRQGRDRLRHQRE